MVLLPGDHFVVGRLRLFSYRVWATKLVIRGFRTTGVSEVVDHRIDLPSIQRSDICPTLLLVQVRVHLLHQGVQRRDHRLGELGILLQGLRSLALDEPLPLGKLGLLLPHVADRHPETRTGLKPAHQSVGLHLVRSGVVLSQPLVVTALSRRLRNLGYADNARITFNYRHGLLLPR